MHVLCVCACMCVLCVCVCVCVCVFPDSVSAIKAIAASVNTALRELVQSKDDSDTDAPVRIMVEDTVQEQDTLGEVPPEEVPGPSPPPKDEMTDGDARLEVTSVSGCSGSGSGCGTLPLGPIHRATPLSIQHPTPLTWRRRGLTLHRDHWTPP